MKKYYCYEEGVQGVYTIEDLKNMWENEIDKSNFEDYESWLDEMLQYQILVETNKTIDVVQLLTAVYDKLESELKTILHGNDLEDAMNLRLCDLERVIDINQYY